PAVAPMHRAGQPVIHYTASGTPQAEHQGDAAAACLGTIGTRTSYACVFCMLKAYVLSNEMGHSSPGFSQGLFCKGATSMSSSTSDATPKEFSRRTLMRNGAAAGVGLMGLSSFLAACASAAQNGSLTIVTNDLPPTSDPGDTRILHNLVADFQSKHKNVTVKPILDQYNSQTYFSKAAAHTQEDAVDAAFTEPPLMI